MSGEGIEIWLKEDWAKHKSNLGKPISSLDEKWKLLPAFLKVRGLVAQHIQSYNFLVKVGIRQIMMANKEIIVEEGNQHFRLEYTDIRVGRPVIQEDQVSYSITPHECRLRDMTYAAPILVDLEYTRGRFLIRKQNVVFGYMPVMLRSCCCVLENNTYSQLAEKNECPYDPGGYFVVRGQEKVILIQEQLSNNRIITQTDNKKRICCSVTSSTYTVKTKTSVLIHKNQIKLKHNSLINEISIVIVFKAMGIASDQDMIQLIGSKYAIQMSPSLEDCNNELVSTQLQALKYIGCRIKQRGNFFNRHTVDQARNFLSQMCLAHVILKNYSFQPKIAYLAMMVRRVFDVVKGAEQDDKDYYGNKRLELAGASLGIMFEDLFKRFNSDLKRNIERAILRRRKTEFDVFQLLQQSKGTITNGLEVAIATGNWRVGRFKMDRPGVTQVLSRLSFISALGMMTRISSQFEKSRKVSGPRALQPSQWGMLCPSDTPEGEGCGLSKNLALLSHVTVDDEELPIARICYNLGVEDATLFSGDELSKENVYMVILNGTILGVHCQPDYFTGLFRHYRRKSQIPAFVSIYKKDVNKMIYIASDQGRVCRPLIIVDNGKPRLTDRHLEELNRNIRQFQDFITDGIIEYVDVNEENNTLIAMSLKHINQNTTHLEIDPMTILGVVAGLIPYPHHNQSPRNTYQCAMGKQAMGSIGYNQLNRMDSLLYLLVYPHRPLVGSHTLDMINYNKLPAGHNGIIAVMSYSGYDIEDAIILNRASLDRGFGRCLVFTKHACFSKRYGDGQTDRIMQSPYPKGEDFSTIPVELQEDRTKFNKALDSLMIKKKKITGDTNKKKELEKKIVKYLTFAKYQSKMQYHKAKFKNIDSDGICKVGVKLDPRNLLVNKFVPVRMDSKLGNPNMRSNSEYKPCPTKFIGGGPGYVDKVLVTSNKDSIQLIKVLMRQTRRPELGDKFSSRHGQKGVCGLIVPQEDMPFNDEGICPDLIMNPHGFPSRMTVGKMIELVSGKAALMDGKFKYGTAFSGDKLSDVSKILVKNGYNCSGKELLTSGITGETLEAYIFFGPVYYQKLKHMVMDKMHARARGPRAPLTRQPTEGRSRDGGLRLGEMERDCLIGYGASALLVERLMISSDKYLTSVCKDCGLIGYKNRCHYCKKDGDMAIVSIPYASKLLIQELQAMNIMVRLRIENY